MSPAQIQMQTAQKTSDARTHTFLTPSTVFWVTVSFSNPLPPPDVKLSSLGSTPPQAAGISVLAGLMGMEGGAHKVIADKAVAPEDAERLLRPGTRRG